MNKTEESLVIAVSKNRHTEGVHKRIISMINNRLRATEEKEKRVHEHWR